VIVDIAAAMHLAATTHKPLPGVFHHLEGTLDRWGYLGVAFFIFFEDFGVPLPGETMLIAAALYAGTGRLNVLAVGLIAFVAAVAGDNVGYAIGRYGGHRVVERYGKYVFLTPERFQHAEAFFVRNGGKIVVIARFVEGLRQLNGIIAGIVEMPWARFVLFNAIGAASWVGVWTTLGYVAGSHVETVSHYTTYVAWGFAALALAFVVRAVIRSRRKRRAKADERASAATEDTRA
jgi:membrane protein DedA with SNARE-associated domain